MNRSFLPDNNLISGAPNGRVTVWNPTSVDNTIKEMYQLDDSISKVNDIKAYLYNDSIQIAVAGISKTNHSGALNIYHLQ